MQTRLRLWQTCGTSSRKIATKMFRERLPFGVTLSTLTTSADSAFRSSFGVRIQVDYPALSKPGLTNQTRWILRCACTFWPTNSLSSSLCARCSPTWRLWLMRCAGRDTSDWERIWRRGGNRTSTANIWWLQTRHSKLTNAHVTSGLSNAVGMPCVKTKSKKSTSWWRKHLRMTVSRPFKIWTWTLVQKVPLRIDLLRKELLLWLWICKMQEWQVTFTSGLEYRRANKSKLTKICGLYSSECTFQKQKKLLTLGKTINRQLRFVNRQAPLLNSKKKAPWFNKQMTLYRKK